MNIGQDRDADLFFDIGENLEPFVDTEATEGFTGTAVRLVVRRLVDERYAQRAGHLLELSRGVQGHLPGFDHTGARNHKQWPLQPDIEPAEFHGDLTAAGPHERLRSRIP